jgi:hypothetical protein
MFYVVPHGKPLTEAVSRSESFFQARTWALREKLSQKKDFDVVEIRHAFSTDETTEENDDDAQG